MGNSDEFDLKARIEEMKPLLEKLSSLIDDAKKDADTSSKELWPTTGDGSSYSHLVRANVNESLSSVADDFGVKRVPTPNTGICVEGERFFLRVLHESDLDKNYAPETAARIGYVRSSLPFPGVRANPDQGQLDLVSAGMQPIADGEAEALGLDPEAVAYATQCQTDGKVHAIALWSYVGGEQKMVLFIPLPKPDASDLTGWWRIDVGDLLEGKAAIESFGSIHPDGVSDSEFFKMPMESEDSGEFGSNERREA